MALGAIGRPYVEGLRVFLRAPRIGNLKLLQLAGLGAASLRKASWEFPKTGIPLRNFQERIPLQDPR